MDCNTFIELIRFNRYIGLFPNVSHCLKQDISIKESEWMDLESNEKFIN